MNALYNLKVEMELKNEIKKYNLEKRQSQMQKRTNEILMFAFI